MSAIDAYGELMKDWDAREKRLAALESRVRSLEGLAAEPPDKPAPPPPADSQIPLIPFTEPPLAYNRGSWDRNPDQKVSHEVIDDRLVVRISQGQQKASRVIRRDFGLFDPDSKGHLREPIGKLRRYELKVLIPRDYDSAGEMCTCGLKFHTHSAHDPAYLAWIIWSTTTRFRRNGPDGARVDYHEKPIRRGHTYALAIEARWSKGKDGTLKAWQDGELVMDFKGPNFRQEEEKGPYLLVGAYWPSAIAAFSNILEFSELRVGDVT